MRVNTPNIFVLNLGLVVVALHEIDLEETATGPHVIGIEFLYRPLKQIAGFVQLLIHKQELAQQKDCIERIRIFRQSLAAQFDRFREGELGGILPVKVDIEADQSLPDPVFRLGVLLFRIQVLQIRQGILRCVAEHGRCEQNLHGLVIARLDFEDPFGLFDGLLLLTVVKQAKGFRCQIFGVFAGYSTQLGPVREGFGIVADLQIGPGKRQGYIGPIGILFKQLFVYIYRRLDFSAPVEEFCIGETGVEHPLFESLIDLHVQSLLVQIPSPVQIVALQLERGQ